MVSQSFAKIGGGEVQNGHFLSHLTWNAPCVLERLALAELTESRIPDDCRMIPDIDGDQCDAASRLYGCGIRDVMQPLLRQTDRESESAAVPTG